MGIFILGALLHIIEYSPFIINRDPLRWLIYTTKGFYNETIYVIIESIEDLKYLNPNVL